MKPELDAIKEQTRRQLEKHDQPTDILYQLARRGVSQTSLADFPELALAFGRVSHFNLAGWSHLIIDFGR